MAQSALSLTIAPRPEIRSNCHVHEFLTMGARGGWGGEGCGSSLPDHPDKGAFQPQTTENTMVQLRTPLPQITYHWHFKASPHAQTVSATKSLYSPQIPVLENCVIDQCYTVDHTSAILQYCPAAIPPCRRQMQKSEKMTVHIMTPRADRTEHEEKQSLHPFQPPTSWCNEDEDHHNRPAI